MILSSRHRIRSSSPGGLRPSTLPLGHGGSPQYWLSHVDGEETIFVSFKPPSPGTEPRTLAWKAAVLTTTLGPRPDCIEQMSDIHIVACHRIPCTLHPGFTRLISRANTNEVVFDWWNSYMHAYLYNYINGKVIILLFYFRRPKGQSDPQSQLITVHLWSNWPVIRVHLQKPVTKYY